MTDDVQVFNEHLAAENERLEKEILELRQMLTRPIQINGPDSTMLNQIVQYLPQLTYLATNVSSVASALQNQTGNASLIGSHISKNTDMMARVAEALERLIPEPPEGGPEPDERFFHDSAGDVWDGRLCKRYGMVWQVFDAGDADPCNPGDVCTVSHKVWSK